MKQVLFFLLLIISALPAFSQDREPPFAPPQHEGQGYGGGFREKLKELGLTEQQKGKLKELRNKSSLSEKRKAWMNERQNLNQMLRNKSTDRPTLQKQLDVLNKTQAELNKERVERIIQLREILTDEQRDKIQLMRKDRMNNRLGGQMMQRQGGMFQGMRQGKEMRQGQEMMQRQEMMQGQGMRQQRLGGMRQQGAPFLRGNNQQQPPMPPQNEGNNDLSEDDFEF